MYLLKNQHLEVVLLDPVFDRERLGTRYCAGGFIFQVTDNVHGPLLSGPTYPDSYNTFDGQGIPDAFNNGPLRVADVQDPTALIIGVGICDLAENRVREFCSWNVESGPSEIVMRTTQALEKFSLELQRTVSLHGRTLRSHTVLRNNGPRLIPMRWFPHPFFPWPEGDELCAFNFPVSFPDKGAYGWSPSGYIRRMKRNWEKGHFLALDHAGNSPLAVFQKHPILGLVGANCSYVPGLLPIWGNANTFSWEPYLERTIGSGQELGWWIDYHF